MEKFYLGAKTTCFCFIYVLVFRPLETKYKKFIDGERYFFTFNRL